MFRLSGKKNMTIRFLGEQWLENKKMTVKPSTYANYSRLLNDHIIPALGNLKYESLNKRDINKYISKLTESGRKDGKGGLSVSMTRDIIKALRAIAKYAQLEYGLKNICDVEKQFDIKTLSELLGHSDVKITLNTYVHSSEKLKRKYVNRLAC